MSGVWKYSAKDTMDGQEAWEKFIMNNVTILYLRHSLAVTKWNEDWIGDACRKFGDITNVYEKENPEGKPKSTSNIIQIGLK